MGKKKICPKCHRTLRTKCFVFNRREKHKLCKQCDKKIGSNPFYDPLLKNKKTKIRYNIKFDEQQALYKTLVNKGLATENAKDRVKNRVKYINFFQRMRNKICKEKEIANSKINDNLLKGLGQK